MKPSFERNFIALSLIFLFINGCDGGRGIPSDTKSAIENADHYELLSLDPKHQPPIPGAEYFHGYRVIGRTVISDRTIQLKLNDALDQGARESSNIAAACFNPRHGIRAVRGNKTLDLVICFECLYVEVFEGEQSLGGFHTSSSPKPAFDEVLRAVGITLSTN